MIHRISCSSSHLIFEVYGAVGVGRLSDITVNYGKLSILLNLYSKEATNSPNARLYFTIFTFHVVSNKGVFSSYGDMFPAEYTVNGSTILVWC